MKLFENKLLVGGMCIFISAVLAFLVLPGVYSDEAKTLTVCKLKQNVTAGTKIEKDMLTETEVGSFGLPGSTIKNKDEIEGKYTKESISADDLLFSTKFSDYVTDERLDKLTAEGKKLISISVASTAAGAAGHLKAGDLISVLYYADNTVKADEELRNIEVYSIENAEAENVEVDSADEKKDKIAATLTLVVTDAQTQKLALAEYSGKIHAIFEKRGGNL